MLSVLVIYLCLAAYYLVISLGVLFLFGLIFYFYFTRKSVVPSINKRDPYFLFFKGDLLFSGVWRSINFFFFFWFILRWIFLFFY